MISWILLAPVCAEDDAFDRGLQYLENPPMMIHARVPPPLPESTGKFEIRRGYRLIETLDEFREVIQKDHQKIRMKPGIYRATKADPPGTFPLKQSGVGRESKTDYQEHIFAVNGSDNSFDLRGVVFETPVSVQSKLTGKAHVADTWHINGSKNVFIGGYLRM